MLVHPKAYPIGVAGIHTREPGSNSSRRTRSSASERQNSVTILSSGGKWGGFATRWASGVCGSPFAVATSIGLRPLSQRVNNPCACKKSLGRMCCDRFYISSCCKIHFWDWLWSLMTGCKYLASHVAENWWNCVSSSYKITLDENPICFHGTSHWSWR